MRDHERHSLHHSLYKLGNDREEHHSFESYYCLKKSKMKIFILALLFESVFSLAVLTKRCFLGQCQVRSIPIRPELPSVEFQIAQKMLKSGNSKDFQKFLQSATKGAKSHRRLKNNLRFRSYLSHRRSLQ